MKGFPLSMRFALLALALLSGCASTHTLAVCRGPLTTLNAPDWTPTEAEMVDLAAACPESK